MVLSAAAATVMSVGVKVMGAEIHTLQITFLRCLVGFLIILPLVGGNYWHARHKGRTEVASPFTLSRRWPFHLLRGLLAAVAINCGYYAISKIPLATVTVLFFTAPLFVTLLAGPLLGEKVGWRRWLATTIGFVGAVVALDPRPQSFETVMIVPFVSSLMFAGALVLGKKLSTTEAPSTILIYTTAVTAVASFPPALIVWVTPNMEQLLLLLAVSIFATSRTYADVRAYAAGEASFVAPFSYVRIIFMSLAGYLVFAELPTATVIAGGVVIIASSLYIAQREAYHRRQISRPAVGPSPD
jgi:drug/metabolite transporter (DMT)-like permease